MNEAPFSLAPDPRFLFASASHSAALAQVAYALERREPLVVITGEIGTGKTLLCRTVLQRLQRKTFLSVINDPMLERDDLLKQMLQDFGVIAKDRTRLTETRRHDLIETLHAFLRSLAPIQAHAVVIIDEAQHLKPDVLEQIRLLSNIDDERGTLLQIILVGQTDLEPLLARPELRQLQQRVSRRLRLEPLNRGEVEQYIQHRLARARDGKRPAQLPGATELAEELAAWDGTSASVEFTPEAIHAVSQLSGGLPRVINLLCDRSLEVAHASRLRIIDDPLVHAASQALGVEDRAATLSTAPAVGATTRSTRAGPDATFWSATRSESEVPAQTVHLEDEPVPVAFLARLRPACGARLCRISCARGLARLCRRGHVVRRSRGPVAGGTASSRGDSAGCLSDARVQRPARPAASGRQHRGAERGGDNGNTDTANGRCSCSHAGRFRASRRAPRGDPAAGSAVHAVHGRRAGRRRPLRHCGGILPDRRAGDLGHVRSRPARSADSAAPLERLAPVALRPVRVAP